MTTKIIKGTGRSRNIIIESANRPEDDEWVPPTYHEMLDYMYDELELPGSMSFWGAVAYLKERLKLRDIR